MYRFLFIFLVAGLALAQTDINGSRNIAGDLTVAGKTRLAVSSSAPASGDCDANNELGRLYVQTGDPASVRTQMFACVQTGVATYSWENVAFKRAATAPATCTVGDVFFDTDATAGQNWYGCTASNTWTLLSGGGGGGTPAGLNEEIQYNNAGAFGGTPGLVWSTALARLKLQNTPPLNNAEALFLFGNPLVSGSALGTYLGVNSAGAYAGDYVRVQKNGANIFLVDNVGNITASGLTTGGGILNGKFDMYELVANGTNRQTIYGPVAVTTDGCVVWPSSEPTGSQILTDSGATSVIDGRTCRVLTWAAGGAGISITRTTVSFSATPTFTRASAIQEWKITLTGNVTSSTVSGAVSGDIFSFEICQDATGGRTFVWPTGFDKASVVDPTASGCSHQTLYWDGAAAQPLAAMYVSGVSGGSINLPGSTSGSATIVPPAVAGTAVLTLPGTSGTLARTADIPASVTTVADEGGSLTQRATLNFTGAGVSCVDNGGSSRTDCTIAGGGGASHDAQNVVVEDEFSGGGGVTGQVGALGWQLQGTINLNGSPNDNFPSLSRGTIALYPTASTSYIELSQGYGTLVPDIHSRTFDSEFIVSPTSTNTGATFFAGWVRQGGLYTNSGIYVKWIQGTDTNWQIFGCNNTTCNSTDSGVAVSANTKYRIRIQVSVAGTYNVTIRSNGGSPSANKTVCASACDVTMAALPNNYYMVPGFQAISASTAVSMLVDYFWFSSTDTTR